MGFQYSCTIYIQFYHFSGGINFWVHFVSLYRRNIVEWIQKVVNHASSDKAKGANYTVYLCVLNHQYYRAGNNCVLAVKVHS